MGAYILFDQVFCIEKIKFTFDPQEQLWCTIETPLKKLK